MNLFIPITRFQVRYELGLGEPFSDIYTLVLKAINTGEANTEKDLSELFCIHPRLIIEILVGLSKAGLVAIETTTVPRLVITQQGRNGLHDGLIKFLSLQEQKTNILMECLTGGVAANRGVKCDTVRKLKADGLWDTRRCIPSHFADPRIDEGQISHLIRPRDGNAYVRWIATPEVISRNFHWLLVNVDLKRNLVFNLPEEWKTRLHPYLLDHARELLEKYGDELAAPLPEWRSDEEKEEAKPDSLITNLNTNPTLIEEKDIFLGGTQNLSLLKDILSNAKSSILIITSQIEPSWLEGDFSGLLQKALARDVKIDILWGAQKGIAGASVPKWLQEIGRSSGRTQNLRYNKLPSGWTANVAIYDGIDGILRTVVGGFPLFASFKADDPAISVCIEEPVIVAELTRSAASLWSSSPNNKMSDVPDRWRQFASAVEQQVVQKKTESEEDTQDGTKCRVSIVRDQSHPPMVRNGIKISQARLGISSNTLIQSRIQNMLDERTFLNDLDLKIICQEVDTEYELVQENFKLALRAYNTMVADMSALITSYNLLAKPKVSRSGDIGLLIEGGIIADRIWEFLFKQ